MTAARRRAILVLLIIAVGVALLVAARLTRGPEPLPERPAEQRPTLLLLTSLPLIFSEGFSLSGGGSAALKALEARYRVVPISATGLEDLSRGRLLLMAQPRAQTAENLVVLDQWVRGGGHLLLLADPQLEWPSERPLGDVLRPPVMFADTGLLGHWGLRLDAPDRRGHATSTLAGFAIRTASPGMLSGSCKISEGGLIADCRIGKGRATVIADADLLDVDRLGPAATHNLDAIAAELSQLEIRK